WIRRWADIGPANRFVSRSGYGFSSSTPFDNQGSVPPSTVLTNILSYVTGGTTSGLMSVSWTWATFNILRADGTSIAVPASSAFSACPTPVLGQVAGGTLGARTIWVRIAYVKNGLI